MAALSYQEAVSRAVPVCRHTTYQPYFVWPILCAVLVTITFVIVAPFSLRDGSGHLAAALLWSYFAAVYEILGIMWGCAKSEELAAALSRIVALKTKETQLWRDQHLRPVWRHPGVIVCGVAAALAAASIAFVIARALSVWIGGSLAFAAWFGFAAFWCGAAMWHIGRVSLAIYRLSKLPLRTAFPHPAGTGISEVSRLALKYFFVYSIAAMLWIAVGMEIFGAISAPYTGLWIIGAAATIIGLVLFAVPQFSIHAAMLQNQREKLSELLRALEAEYVSATTTEGTADSRRVAELLEFYRFVSRFPTWPFDLRVASQLIPASALPLLPQLVRYMFPDVFGSGR